MVARVDSRITRSSPRSNSCRSRANDFPRVFALPVEISLRFLKKRLLNDCRKEGLSWTTSELELDYSFNQINSIRSDRLIRYSIRISKLGFRKKPFFTIWKS